LKKPQIFDFAQCSKVERSQNPIFFFTPVPKQVAEQMGAIVRAGFVNL
jgi:hypothetical protein